MAGDDRDHSQDTEEEVNYLGCVLQIQVDSKLGKFHKVQRVHCSAVCSFIVWFFPPKFAANPNIAVRPVMNILSSNIDYTGCHAQLEKTQTVTFLPVCWAWGSLV